MSNNGIRLFCRLCMLPAEQGPGKTRDLPEGPGWCHDNCWEFFKSSRPEPLREPIRDEPEDNSCFPPSWHWKCPQCSLRVVSTQQPQCWGCRRWMKNDGR